MDDRVMVVGCLSSDADGTKVILQRTPQTWMAALHGLMG
jgi:hypothetical protein